MNNKFNKNIVCLANAANSLIQCFSNIIEDGRSGIVLICLIQAGSIYIDPILIANFISPQSKDGGWADVSETATILFCCRSNKWTGISLDKSVSWLESQRGIEGAWGRTYRDKPRIPVTGWVLTLLPELGDDKALAWLEAEWEKDLAASTKLTYKGALTLKAFASVGRMPKNISLISNTIDYLVNEQNDDGGYGPWKDHPVGSEPWSTGIALIGLTAWPDLVPTGTLEKALRWLGRTQLPNGLWPCHYIEEGSAYCYWGAVEAMKLLKRREL